MRELGTASVTPVKLSQNQTQSEKQYNTTEERDQPKNELFKRTGQLY